MRELNRRAQFRELYRVFLQHLLEPEGMARDGDVRAKLCQLLGVVAVPGLSAARALYQGLLANDVKTVWELRGVRTSLVVFSMAVAALGALLQWEVLFPDRRDFLVLTVMPVRLREIFYAKVASLGVFLALLAGVVNAGPLAAMLLLLTFGEGTRNLAFFGVVAVYIAVSSLAALFGFVSVLALQGLSISLLTPAAFRKASPWIQMSAMSVVVVGCITYPLYSDVRMVSLVFPGWLYKLPPYWFASLHELWLGTATEPYRGLAWRGITALALAFGVFVLTWAAGFQRQAKRTLEVGVAGVA